MKVKISILDDELVIVTISGEFSIFDDDFENFSKEVIAYSKLGIYRYILDLNELTYIDSSGIGVIIRLATAAMRKETKVCVVCDNPHVKRVFLVANIDRILEFVNSIQEGIEFFKNNTDLRLSKEYFP